MYCDSACSKKHWRRGGGVSEVCEAALPHKETCPRTFDDPVAELRRCVCCGADGAARRCSLCLEVRYCDAACSAQHWRDGGGCVLGGNDAPHKTACPRSHASSDTSDDDE
jgi:hypothetical protein